MVLSGHARYNSTISNRTNVCGGIKKAGLTSIVGFSRVFNLSHNLARVETKKSNVCVVSTTIQTQQTGYRATLG